MAIHHLPQEHRSPDRDLDLSIIVPCRDEAPNLPGLVDALTRAFPADASPRVEFVVVDDGSQDATASLLAELMQEEPRLVPVLRKTSGGQTAALWDGLHVAHGRWIAHLDGDLQNDPADLHGLMELAESGFDAVFGIRTSRNDSWARRVSSRIAGAVRRAFLHDHIRDIGCSTRVVRFEVLAAIPQVRDLHRYLPAVIERAGGRIVQVPVHHAPRRFGSSKYTNLGRALRGIVDLPRMVRLARHLERNRGW